MNYKCIIYCDTNDLMESESLNSIFDNLDCLISELKGKSKNMNTCVCELVPSLSEELNNKIDDFNIKLHQWATVNKI